MNFPAPATCVQIQASFSCYECATLRQSGDLPLAPVAQVANLLFRRLPVGATQLNPAAAETEDFDKANVQQILNENSLAERLQSPIRRMKLKCQAGLLALGMLLAALVAGCGTNSHPQSPVFARFDLFPAFTNALDQADVISITFRYSTNFNAVQKIGLDGMVNLEGVGEVKAEGKTVQQLQDELTALYKAQVKDDPITVRIVAAAAAVYVTGAVIRPGKIPMERRMTVIDAIAEAGGFDQSRAKLSKVSVLRVNGDTQKIYWLNLNRMMEGKDTAPFYLKPFDVVRVPTKTFNF